MRWILRNKYRLSVSLVILGSVAAAAAGGFALYRGYRAVLPDVSLLKSAYPVVVGKDGKDILFKLSKSRPPHWKGLGEISRYAIKAVLLSEDAGFYRHGAYDAEAIRSAWEYNRRPGVRIKRGGSTITQQVVKNIFLTPEKTLTRKVRELLLAIELEHVLPKRKILEIYLNIAEWGPGVYGIDQAARRYFGKTPAELSPRDAAVLAFMLPNPSRYQYSLRPGGGLSDFGANRVEAILTRMLKAGDISDEELSSYLPDKKDPVSSDL